MWKDGIITKRLLFYHPSVKKEWSRKTVVKIASGSNIYQKEGIIVLQFKTKAVIAKADAEIAFVVLALHFFTIG